MQPLPDNEVHLWYASPVQLMADPAGVEEVSGWLSSVETARMERFRFEKDRELYLTAHALLRSVLSRYAPVSPAAWQFVAGSHGKPEIHGPEERRQLRFNLSHTRGLAAVAVSAQGEIGVDVESVDQPGDSLRRILAPMELAQLDAWPEQERHGGSIEFWTLREAYLKARGTGLTFDSGDFGFRLARGQPPRPWFSQQLHEDPAAWHFWQDVPDPGYRAAVAIHCPDASAPALSLHIFPAGSVEIFMNSK